VDNFARTTVRSAARRETPAVSPEQSPARHANPTNTPAIPAVTSASATVTPLRAPIPEDDPTVTELPRPTWSHDRFASELHPGFRVESLAARRGRREMRPEHTTARARRLPLRRKVLAISLLRASM
jgi:hypothetical protein